MNYGNKFSSFWNDLNSNGQNENQGYMIGGDNKDAYYNNTKAILRHWFLNIVVNRFQYLNVPTSLNTNLMEANFLNGYAGNAIGWADNALRVLGVVKGGTNFGKAQITPLTRNYYAGTVDYFDMFNDKDLAKLSQINPAHPEEMGDYTVMFNKNTSLYMAGWFDDIRVIEHYSSSLANILTLKMLNRNNFKTSFSLIGNNGELSSHLYFSEWQAGVQAIGIDEDYDPSQQVQAFTPNVPDFQMTLENAYYSEFGQFLNYFGINNPAIKKASGVSQVESESNNSLISLSASVYLNARQDALDILNEESKYLYNAGLIPAPLDMHVQFNYSALLATTAQVSEMIQAQHTGAMMQAQPNPMITPEVRGRQEGRY